MFFDPVEGDALIGSEPNNRGVRLRHRFVRQHPTWLRRALSTISAARLS